MSPADVVDIARDAIWVLIKVAGPIMVIALAVGLVISLAQALTQVQEMTLAFVPKMLAIFVGLILFMPFMITSMTTFMQQIAARIASLQ
jgi:flagellar biosynthetic protein FliQ